MTNILLVFLVGVMVAVNPVSANVLVEFDTAVEVLAFTTCNTLHAGNAAAAIVPVN
jgi:hypothetical protein